jgi:hypothetical protein
MNPAHRLLSLALALLGGAMPRVAESLAFGLLNIF